MVGEGGGELATLLNFAGYPCHSTGAHESSDCRHLPAIARATEVLQLVKLLISGHIKTDFLSECRGPVGSTHCVLKPLVQAPAWGTTTLTYFVVFLSPFEQILIKYIAIDPNRFFHTLSFNNLPTIRHYIVSNAETFVK